MTNREIKETLVELIENDELTEYQLDYILKWIQGNGYVSGEDEQVQLEKDIKNNLYGEEY